MIGIEIIFWIYFIGQIIYLYWVWKTDDGDINGFR
jgi:hypothetical protein